VKKWLGRIGKIIYMFVIGAQHFHNFFCRAACRSRISSHRPAGKFVRNRFHNISSSSRSCRAARGFILKNLIAFQNGCFKRFRLIGRMI